MLRDVSLCLPAGRIAGLLRPNGCGKTTLVRALVGVQRGVAGDDPQGRLPQLGLGDGEQQGAGRGG